MTTKTSAAKGPPSTGLADEKAAMNKPAPELKPPEERQADSTPASPVQTPMARLAGQVAIDPRARVTVVDEKNGSHNYVNEEAAMAAWGSKVERMEYVGFTPATVSFVIRPVPPPPR